MELNRTNFPKKRYTNRIIQFGEGNFLRCFFDWQMDILNEKTSLDAGVTIVRPIDSDYLPLLDTQDGLYTSIIRGINESGEVVKDYRIISSVNKEVPVYKEFDTYLQLAHDPNFKLIVSNTTEAGITFDANDKYDDKPQHSYPGKLTRLLHERFKVFKGAKDKGFILLPCELIDYNGDALKKAVLQFAKLWQLESDFTTWLETANIWCSTLVDRIVTGYPKDEKAQLEKELDYHDTFMTTGEYFYLFVIQGPKDILEETLHLNEVNFNIKIVPDLKPFKTRKVGILNGSHSSIVPVSYLYGIDTVRESMENPDINKYLSNVLNKEIIPALDMDKDELKSFADAVLNRFKNPYVKHFLLDISLNSTSKYRARILPQVLSYYKKKGELPHGLLFALASTIRFFKGERNGEKINLRDEQKFLDMYSQAWGNFSGDYDKLVTSILSSQDAWGQDLTQLGDMKKIVTQYLELIDTKGMKEAIKEVIA